VALVFGIIGLIVAFGGLNDVSKYEDFLLVIAYWIAPWLGVVFVDRLLRRGTDIQALLGDRKYLNWAGPIAMAVGIIVSIWLFSNQTKYQGVLVKSHPALGDLTFEVGFAIAAILYLVLFLATRPTQGPPASATTATAATSSV
jgi:purine-cytosine permease-like protein